MTGETNGATASAPGKYKFAFWFTVTNDARFLSHRDSLRLWQRALTRGQLAVRYSEGFNPHMRVSLPWPRNVGMSSQAEVLVGEFVRDYEPETMRQKLSGQLPKDIKLLRVEAINPCGTWQPLRVHYQINLEPGIDRDTLAQRIEGFQQAPAWCVTRAAHGRHPSSTIDLRRGVTNIQLKSEVLFCTIEVGRRQTARLDELLEALEIKSPLQLTHINRIAVEYTV